MLIFTTLQNALIEYLRNRHKPIKTAFVLRGSKMSAREAFQLQVPIGVFEDLAAKNYSIIGTCGENKEWRSNPDKLQSEANNETLQVDIEIRDC